jgi:hypothetical protein
MSIEPKLRDAILIELVPGQGPIAAITDALGRIREGLNLPASDEQACQAIAEPRVTAYLRGVPPDMTVERVAALARTMLGPLATGEIEVSRLSAMRVHAGASPDATPHYHYVVRTDVAPGSEEELERWYDEEHMPALAAVPGVVLAQRLVSRDAPPRYYACYDMVSPDVLRSPEWLAVRGTEWSGRVRPMFRHTRRIVSRLLTLADAPKGKVS